MKHQYLVRLVAGYVALGYAVAYPLSFLVAQSLRGHVVAAQGVPRCLEQPDPRYGLSRSDLLVGALVGTVLVALEVWGVTFAASLGSWGIPSLLILWIGPVLLSTSLRVRRDVINELFDGALLVQGFVLTARLARGTSVAVAQQWLGAEIRAVGWVADEGLRGFYERPHDRGAAVPPTVSRSPDRVDPTSTCSRSDWGQSS